MRSLPEPLRGHVVVLSPHLDDAIFSLGATIARATRSGVKVEILTVFGCDPTSHEGANHWDQRGGFATEGEAASARRAEDRRACEIVGAEPRWLPYRGGGYAPHRDADAVWAEIVENAATADALLVPGFPLRNADHAWLAQLLRERPLPGVRTGWYAEQPYRFMVRNDPSLQGDAWTRVSVALGDRLRKRKAILAYTSQLPLLSFAAKRSRKLDRMLLHEALHGGEVVSWT